MLLSLLFLPGERDATGGWQPRGRRLRDPSAVREPATAECAAAGAEEVVRARAGAGGSGLYKQLLFLYKK